MQEKLSIDIIDKIIDKSLTELFYLCKDYDVNVYVKRYFNLLVGFLKLSVDIFYNAVSKNDIIFFDISYCLFDITYKGLKFNFNKEKLFDKSYENYMINLLCQYEKNIVGELLRKYQKINFPYNNAHIIMNTFEDEVFSNNNKNLQYDETIVSDKYMHYKTMLTNSLNKFVEYVPYGVVNDIITKLENDKSNENTIKK